MKPARKHVRCICIELRTDLFYTHAAHSHSATMCLRSSAENCEIISQILIETLRHPSLNLIDPEEL